MKKPDRYLVKLGGIYYYQRRVPKRFSHIDTRTKPRLSLRTDNLDLARIRRDHLEEADEQMWSALALEALEAGAKGTPSQAVSAAARKRYQAAVSRAMAFGFAYKTAEDLAAVPSTYELLDRIAVLERQLNQRGALVPARGETEALLGGVSDPRQSVTVSQAFEVFIKEIAFDDVYNKSPAQKRSWEKTKRTSINYFLDQIGDMPVDEITRETAIAYQNWWKARMLPQEDGSDPVTPNTANRHIGNMRSLLQRYFDFIGEPEREDPFRGMYFKGKTKDAARVPFSDDWVRTRILTPGMFDALNAELRVMIFLLIETGARLSELCGLRAEDIRLKAAVPHILIRSEQNRELKTETSEREIPLVGVAEIAMHAAPEGFPRYYDKATLASANLMKAFRQRNLLPTRKHVIYSFRHAFEDRMLHAELDYGLRCALMGHKNDRPEYGSGGTLDHKRGQLLKIAHPFDPALFQSAPLKVA